MVRGALVAIAIAGSMFNHAQAQSGGTPGWPGGPLLEPPSQCRELLVMRDELQRQGEAIKAANKRKASLTVACRLFRDYVAAEQRILRNLEAYGSACGVPPQVYQQVRGSHAKVQQIAEEVCDAAGPLPASDDPPRRFDSPGPPFKTYMPSYEKPRPLIIDVLPFKMGSWRQP
jgi:hypothetical protein